MPHDWIIDALVASACQRRSELEACLRGWITSAQLKPGNRLPSSREVSAALGIARNSVTAAYEQLVAEGYLEGRHGSGTYVATLPQLPATTPATRLTARGLSARGAQLLAASRLPTGLIGAFAPGVPELTRFPHALWQRLQSRHQRSASPDMFGYRNDGGYLPLRSALADYLTFARGVRCHSEQIVITQGAQGALELAARLLAEPGETAWVEEPGYAGAHAALQGAGLRLAPVTVDAHGLSLAQAAHSPAPRLIYLTPSHQYPSAVVMPLSRRLQILAHAEACGAWVIEDDYDSEFRYSSAPIPALQGIARSDCVIYIGTFSKVMYPALRLGYMVLPDALVDAFRRCNARLYREGHYPLQAALAEFIGSGHFARHIRAMRELYRQRQTLLRAVLAQELGDTLPLSAGEAGLHLLARLPDGYDELALSARAASEGLWLRPWSAHCLLSGPERALVLGYAGVEETALQSAARRLAQLLTQDPAFVAAHA
ncbi:PLP-dependent aminotransferase family protein [Craterilacuibacter sp. RT1T]|uniref:MocR-like pyridoxine biosynthesis transcription factor PdxR n=1 Tax=Craterilacuibacter sp. RT1T TaxID=2942211 RepID=UPI0020C01D78|nr:PLP-dependent aminotransferase family protein [Craterilacuibacter sp. RT1T]MCL6261780.1 PLP-dependent aminotransferase family protein [Craterilacuibacter sp. RT1T]